LSAGNTKKAAIQFTGKKRVSRARPAAMPLTVALGISQLGGITRTWETSSHYFAQVPLPSLTHLIPRAAYRSVSLREPVSVR